jgi:hypothetical protein
VKKPNMVTLSLVVVVGLAAISAEPASATEWLLNGAAIVSPVSVDSEGSYLLTDINFFITWDLLCNFTDEGTVGAGARGVTVTVTVTATCSLMSGECGSPVVKAIDLPWGTELVLNGSEIRNNIKAEGKGEPGYEITCNTILGLVKDVCKTEKGSERFVVNNASGVELESDGLTAPSNCSVGGVESGLIEGPHLILTLTGTLTIS